MSNLWSSIRSSSPISFADYLGQLSFNGLSYPLTPQTTLGQKQEEVRADFGGIVQDAYKQNGVIFACSVARMLLFSEARFQFRRQRNGRPGELFGTAALRLLENPWQGGTTGDLLNRMIQDADLSGNFFAVRRPSGLKRAQPDWMTIVVGSASDPDAGAGHLDAEVLGYIYKPGGAGSSEPAEPLLREQVVHFAPIPDPAASYRGMSWMTPVIREVMGDNAATTHKLKFFEQGATPNLVVKLDSAIQPEAFHRWVDLMESKHAGTLNAYKTLYLGGGADASVVGANLEQVDFKNVQGAGETRIAAAAGIPPIIVGLSEGLQSATYSNYGQARRRLADGTMRPLWRQAAGALATVVDVPGDAELWYDDRDIPFLQEDRQDEATIQTADAITISTLIDAGFEPATVVEAVTSGDFARLSHTGLVSVQLQAPGSDPSGGEPSTNGNGERHAGLRALQKLVALKTKETA